MKNRIVLSIIITILLLLAMTFSLSWFNNKNHEESITMILSKTAYSYLPVEAKEYIEQVYEETGEIIFTEKNKEIGKPYLNPQYVEYLGLTEEDREDLEIIPEVYVLDYQYSPSPQSEELPSSYDLRNVEGRNYITPIKNQYSTGLCWAFSAIEQAESYLMVTNDKPYSELTEKFSVRQLDYATSINAIKGYENPYGKTELLGGGNFYFSSDIMSDGLSLVSDELMPFNSSNDTKPLYEVLNYNNSRYEVDSTIEIPRISNAILRDPQYSECLDLDNIQDIGACLDQIGQRYKDMYIAEIKNSIIKYGGGVVDATAPDTACSFKNIDGSNTIEISDQCFNSEDGHAMHIIGYDDEYEYSYCKGKTNREVFDDNCQTGTLVQGKGAFILRNSWGQSYYPYAYLTYDSFNVGAASANVSFITSLSSMEDRTWDNNYSSNMNYKGSVKAKKTTTQTFVKNIDSQEKIEKIKFRPIAQDGEFTISINIDGQSHVIDNKIITSYPGIYTVDLSNENFIIDDSEFSVTITGNQSYLIDQSISVFTSNVDKNPTIETEDVVTDSKDFYLYSKTKNIASNEKLSYSLFDGEEEIEDALTVEDNIVAFNNVNTHLIIKKPLQQGEYTLKINYGEYTEDVKFTFSKAQFLDGSGSMEDPYLIHNEQEMRRIVDDLGAYYKLANNIVLTENWTPIGTEEEPFRGTLYGDNYETGGSYEISGLKIIDDKLEYGGLFGCVSPQNSVSVRNVTIKDANIKVQGDAGALIGKLIINEKSQPTIQNIYIINGTIEGNIAGALIGTMSGDSNSNPLFFNIFNSSTVHGTYSSGLIGQTSINGYFDTIQNIGIVISNDEDLNESKHNSFIGNISGSANPYIRNYIITGFSKSKSKIFNHLTNVDIFYGDHGHILKAKDNTHSFVDSESRNLNSFDNIQDIKDESNYSEWSNFSKWEIKTIDGITRIPIIKGVDFEYTSVQDIEIKKYETISLLDYISPYTDASRITYSIKENENNIKVYDVFEDGETYPSNIMIKGLQSGETTIHLVSNYDGFEKDINIRVVSEKTDTPVITYYFDDDKSESYIQQLTALQSFTLKANEFVKEGYIFKEWNTMEDGSGISYNDGSLFEGGIDENLELYAQWEEGTPYIVKDFHYDEVNNYIDMIDPNITVAEYQEKMELINGYTIDVGYKTIDGKNVLYTGAKTTIYKNENIYLELINIVKGDVTGTGKVTMADVMKTATHMLEGNVIEEDCYLKAADVTGDGNIRMSDVMKIANYVLEGGSL